MYAYDYLAKARHDDLMRTAAQSHLAAQARRARGPRRLRLITARTWRLARLRPHKATT